MKKILTGLCVSALAISFVAAPAVAAPRLMPTVDRAETSNVIQVQQTRQERRREARQDRREFRREARQDRREFRRDMRRAERSGYYRGYNGYRDYRPGYRRHSDGFWYPAAAFIAGAIITGAIQAERRSGGNAHVEWCYDRYRSYRASDNTFQPYNGGRQQCYSPYN
ncbi:MAG: BA14K family protein [Rhizobiaceae bacterium]